MKSKFTLSCMIVIILFAFSCNETPTPKSSTLKKPSKNYLVKKNMEAINASILKITRTEYGPNGAQSWYGHCCLYANKFDKSYLALPKHCFPYKKGVRYDVELTDFKGRKINLESYEYFPAKNDIDAEILVVDRIDGIPNLCSRDMISPKGEVGDSAVILCPFDAREVRLKYGTISEENTIKANTLYDEHGDSGGLIVGQFGVFGILVSGLGGTTYYVPMRIFEDIYEEIVEKQSKQN